MNYDDFKKLPADEAIQVAAQYSGFDANDIRSMWNTESGMGQNKGPSRAGAVGDFQIMPQTQATLEQRMGQEFDPMDFHDSLYMGMEVLRENLTHFGNKADALRAYNSGWDRNKWDNPETAAYAGKVLGPEEAALQGTYAQTQGLPNFTKTGIRAQAVEESGLVDQTGMGDISPVFEGIYEPEIEDTGLYDEDALRLSNERQHAGFTEAALDSMVSNTITGKLVEAWNRGEPDPTFDPASKDNLERIQQAGLYGNDQMMDYVTGARNADDFRNRLGVAQERIDLFRRMNNGKDFGSTAGMFLGAMADPVGIAATVGAGAVAATVRGAAAASRASMIARGAAGGAAENVAAGVVLNSADNQRFQWHTLFEDGVMGAGLGAIGGLVVRNDGRMNNHPEVSVPPDFQPVMTAAARAVQDVVDSATGRAWDHGLTRSAADVGNAWDGTVSTHIDDLGSSGLGDMPARGPMRVTAGEDGRVSIMNAPEEPRLAPINGYSSRLGYRPEPTLGSKDYRSLHDSGVITELRTADDLDNASDYQRMHGEEIPPDAKAVYIPQDDRVYVFRDRLTPEEAKNPMGLVMHEVGVHYGLERAIGTENYTRVLESLTKSNDARIKSALKAVPGDTPEHLRLEEALGYLVEKHPDIGVVKKLVANIRNWMRENLSMFRDLAITADDAIAYVQGSLARVRKEGRLSANLTFPYVWHGSPVKGIESLDLRHAGSGEGRSAFGFGHYVTSEKGTAIDYRNKESARRGAAPETGGLYRLKVNANPEQMLDWDAPASQRADALRAAGVPEDKLSGTGGEAYNALSDALGSQQAASAALASAGVPGIRYQTGRTRGSDAPNSNYVIFNNDGLSMEARYSRAGGTVSEQPLNDREQLVKERLDKVNATVDPNQADQIRRTQAWLEKRPEALKGMDQWAQSPGVTMSNSPNEYARKAGALLFENAMGSAGRPEQGSVAIHYDLLFRAYRDAPMEQARPHILALMTPKERMYWAFGGTGGYTRISTAVAEERLRHRAAVARGSKYQSTAPDDIQALAKILDDQMFKMVDDGRAAGSAYAGKVFGSGVVGWMPQVWDWRRFQAAHTTNPQVWEALKENFRRQYIERQVDPVWQKMLDEGVDPMEMQAVRTRLLEQVEHQVNTRMNESITDPNTRAGMDTGKFESMAGELLQENFQGLPVTADVVTKFKQILAAHIGDRSRTEFDMLREVDGVRLLDYVEHDLVTTLSHTAHKFAGQNAMAKHGFNDYPDFEAMINLMRKTGARPIDIEMAKFGGRSFGFGEMKLGDRTLLAAVRNFTYAAMLGKLGFAQLADVSAILSATGVSSLARLLGNGLSRESPLVKQIGQMFGPGAIGADYRIQSFVADVQPNGRSLNGAGQRILKVSQRGAQMVSWVSGANHVTKLLHKAFLPIMAENLVRAARGLDGGMSPRRLADAGLTQETLNRIKGQLDKYEPNRKAGHAFQWDKWDDQYAADRLVEAMHRITAQVFNRAMVGEAAPWRSESALGALISQFHNYGMNAMEKQLGRNLAINDVNTHTSLAIGIAWSTLLYYSRIQVNTMGMSSDKAQEYIERNTTPARLTQGMLTFFNMSGIGAEVFGMGEVLFGGNSYQAGSGPVAGVGYLTNVSRAANALGGILTGQSDNTKKDLSTILKIVPGGNSIPATWGINNLKNDD